MLHILQKSFTQNHLIRQFPEYVQFVKKMSVNDIEEKHSREQCKRENEENVEEPNKKLCTDENQVKEKKEKKVKHAMLLAYNGYNYQGMQFNPLCTTVESELFKAFKKVGIMEEPDLCEPYQIKFQRAARTDKSVSAARQTVSFLMTKNTYKPEDLNAHLPPDIRVFSIKRATKGFDSKGNCSGRTYSYILPTHIFSEIPLEKFLESDYRITEDVIHKINEVLKCFVGSHNFHNYSSKIHALDPRAKRYILHFRCEEPFVRKKEFITISVKGQSFILHQIRKMIGAMVAVMREIATTEKIQASFLQERLKIPLAPGEGLFLDKTHFEKYNQRYGNDGVHEPLTWNDVEEDVVKFKKENIINVITDRELEQQLMIKWVDYCISTSDDFFRPYEKTERETGAENGVEKGQDNVDGNGEGEIKESEERCVNN